MRTGVWKDPVQGRCRVGKLNLDGDGPQYISSNTLDEVSHATFLNGYLESKGAEPVTTAEESEPTVTVEEPDTKYSRADEAK